MMTFITKLASLRLTLAGVIFLIATIFLTYTQAEQRDNWLLLPITLLSINLLAAILVNPRFRKHTWLLMFHICLLLVIILAGLSNLLRFEGRVEIVEGQRFSEVVVEPVIQGSGYVQSISQVDFIQGPIEISFHRGLHRDKTISELYVPMSLTGVQRVQAGDQDTFKVNGYRFSTTSNKGYAARMVWVDNSTGVVNNGVVHFPSFPFNDWKQKNQWQLVNGKKITAELKIQSPIRSEKRWIMNNNVTASILVNIDNKQHLLHKGESLQLDGGKLYFQGVLLWMGYRVDYNPVLPWLFVAALLSVISLGIHYYSKLAEQEKNKKKEYIKYAEYEHDQLASH